LPEPDKKYDLEERTALFAERVRDFCLRLPKNVANAEYLLQLIKAGSQRIYFNFYSNSKETRKLNFLSYLVLVS